MRFGMLFPITSFSWPCTGIEIVQFLIQFIWMWVFNFHCQMGIIRATLLTTKSICGLLLVLFTCSSIFLLKTICIMQFFSIFIDLKQNKRIMSLKYNNNRANAYFYARNLKPPVSSMKMLADFKAFPVRTLFGAMWWNSKRHCLPSVNPVK